MNNVIKDLENKKNELEEYNAIYLSILRKEEQIRMWSAILDKWNDKLRKLCEYGKDEYPIKIHLSENFTLIASFNRDVFDLIKDKHNKNVFDFLFKELKKISSIEDWEISDFDLSYYFLIVLDNKKNSIRLKIPLINSEIVNVLNFYLKHQINKEK